MMKQPLTAVVIAKNSSATIAQCVSALKFCDHVIVGENQSMDNTAALAVQAGAEVRQVVWEGYGRTKNRLIESVASGWILSIDADEVVTPELARQIRETVDLDAAPVAYALNRRNYFLGQVVRHCGWHPDWQLRLFKVGTARFEEKHVHEALRAQGPTNRLVAPLDHYSYATLEEYLARLNHYTGLAAKDRFERGKMVSMGRILFDPPWTFFKMYIIKQGWRDGFIGLALCLFSALNTLVKHAKHWEMIRKAKEQVAERTI